MFVIYTSHNLRIAQKPVSIKNYLGYMSSFHNSSQTNVTYYRPSAKQFWFTTQWINFNLTAFDTFQIILIGKVCSNAFFMPRIITRRHPTSRIKFRRWDQRIRIYLWMKIPPTTFSKRPAIVLPNIPRLNFTETNISRTII